MRENLSAPGTVSEWVKISKQALENLNYHNIVQDPLYARLSARYGYDDYIIVNIRNKEDNRVLLEFDVSSPKMIQQFKTASAQIIRQMQNEYERKEEEKKYGKIPTQNASLNYQDDYDDDEDDFTIPDYEAEEGDFIERTRYLPDDTLMLREFDQEDSPYDDIKRKSRRLIKKPWFTWVMLFVFPPVGLFLLWYNHKFKVLPRILVSIGFFLYFVLVWVGFFGIDTGFNKENIQRFYNNQQYRITRFFNDVDNNSIIDPNPDLELDETLQPPLTVEETPETQPSENNIIENFFNNISNLFNGNSNVESP